MSTASQYEARARMRTTIKVMVLTAAGATSVVLSALALMRQY